MHDNLVKNDRNKKRLKELAIVEKLEERKFSPKNWRFLKVFVNLVFDHTQKRESSLIHFLSCECTYTLFSSKLFFRTSVYLFSFLLSVFYHKVEPDERMLLCKAIFNPFWRPFSPLFFKSFAPHLVSHPHSFHFDFTASPHSQSVSLSLSFSLILVAFVSSSFDDLF